MTKSEELREKRGREGLAPDPLAVVVSARLDLPGTCRSSTSPSNGW